MRESSRARRATSAAQRRVQRRFRDLWSNDDGDNYSAAQRVLDGAYTWAEAGILDPVALAQAKA